MKLEVLLEMYSAYVLNGKSRRQLLKMFPPKYNNVIAHHVTINAGVRKDAPIPHPAKIVVVGYSDDGDSIEALVVSVNGKIQRPDGYLYHITWSLDRAKGRKPVDSKRLTKQGYVPVEPVEVKTTPEILK